LFGKRILHDRATRGDRAAKFSPNLAKPSKAEQSPDQIFPRKKALISLDFLVRIAPFQRLALTPWGKNVFSIFAPFRRKLSVH
jgi:hypothetical protein